MENSKNIIKNNSEILFIYDATMCNPNGDIDEENKPRMDYATETNLVSDVRLKRYIRDYWISEGKEVFVSQVNGETVDATGRIAKALVDFVEKNREKYADLVLQNKDWKSMKATDIGKYLNKINPNEIFIDTRVFGAVLPIKSDTSSGISASYTGPVQFNWGRSFNKVTIVDSSSISSIFAGKGNEHSTIGKDWRLYYSAIGFWGIVSARWAKITGMTEEDLADLEDALIHSIPLWVTRTKVNQKPLLYIRIEYKDSKTIYGDKRHLIKINPEENLRSTKDYTMNLEKFLEFINTNKSSINKITFWKNCELKTAPENIFENSGLNIEIKKL